MAEKKENKTESLKNKLFMSNKNGYFAAKKKDLEQIDGFAKGYTEFINKSKTERLFAKNMADMARDNGFAEFDPDKKYKPGDRVYYLHRSKALILCVIGEKPVKEGVRIAAAHIDSPRIDLKPNPLYEADELALFKTHYYGGIKKYQWTTIPLAMYGVIVKADGEKIDVAMGDKPDEPKFVITDLLPHLAAQQSKRTLSDGVRGEELNILIGSRPFNDDKESQAVKLNIMQMLNDKYGIVEGDFESAELEFVPAFDAYDIGFDRSLVGGYGHDDRVCAYPAAMAALACKKPQYTAITVLTDKEEIGSEGNTGLQSAYMVNFINDLARMQKCDGYDVLRHSKCLSADVTAAYDPTFADVNEKQNAAYCNHGVCIMKYTGSRGKSGTSDANAEYMGEIRKMLNDNKIVWQTGELGKVDVGGGGTVAMYIANLDVDTVDLGVPVLSMHSPYEVISKLDLYMAYRAFSVFFEN